MADRERDDDVERAVRDLLKQWLGRLAIAGVGAAGGAGVTYATGEASPATSIEQPAPRPAEVVVTTPPSPESAACQVSAQTERMCARAVHDARQAIDYFAELAEACELPTDARPSKP